MVGTHSNATVQTNPSLAVVIPIIESRATLMDKNDSLSISLTETRPFVPLQNLYYAYRSHININTIPARKKKQIAKSTNERVS